MADTPLPDPPVPGRPAGVRRRRRELPDSFVAAHLDRRTLEVSALATMTTLGAANGGAFSRAQALGAGVSDATIRRLLSSGHWVRRAYGVYTDRAAAELAEHDPLHDLRLRLGTLNVSATGLVAGSHLTSARLSDIPLPHSAGYPLHVIRLVGLDHRAFPGAILHTHEIDAADLTVVDGLTVTTPARAALEIACLVPRAWAVAAVDSVLHRGLATTEDLAATLERLPVPPGRSAAAVAVGLSDGRAESPHESLSRIRFLDAGLPAPDLQTPVYDERGLIGYADFLWVDRAVIGEADGLLKYQTRDNLIAEKLREDRLRDAGYEVVRWTWDELNRTPELVIARIRRAFDRTADRRRAA